MSESFNNGFETSHYPPFGLFGEGFNDIDSGRCTGEAPLVLLMLLQLLR